VYSLKNFAGASQAIADLSTQGLPTGTGECCAPKLLSYAAKHQLTPLTLAEFWWGKETAEKTPGNFYPACAERCQPILGFLLSGLEKKTFSEIITTPEVSLEILYEDDDLLAINKPAGLPSIPGRSSHNYDSAFSRLKRDLDQIFLVHRLDQDTSGVLLFAKNPDTQQQLQTQFRRRQIVKIYNALLEKPCIRDEGIIDLPICPDPGDRPRQKVDLQQGKPSQTSFKKIHENHIELKPITGRTHQLRVHCAHPQGLGNPILGDRLYGSVNAPRLHLHATSIALEHPQTKQKIYICKTVSF
jgi:tRNA pseudouridine32 synthase/23S rRNA pseudouridine746 synthase